MKWLMTALTVGLLRAAPHIVVDGSVTDWAQIAPNFVAQNPAQPVRAISVTADAQRLFVRVTFNHQYNIHAIPGGLTLIASAGTSTPAAASASIGFDFSSGTTVLTYPNGAGGPVSKGTPIAGGVHDLGLVTAPTFVAHDVEIGFSRNRTAGGQPAIFAGRVVRWQVAVRDNAGKVVQQGEFTSQLPPLQTTSASAAQDPLRRSAPGGVRVLAWNVHNRSWPQSPEPYRRILRALQPDIVLLGEVSAATSESWIRTFLQSLRPDGQEWHLVIAQTGGWERSLVATHWPLRRAFDEVWHRPEIVQRLGPPVEPTLAKPTSPRKGLEAGITAVGAFIDTGAGTLLATALDLACCGSVPESVQNQRREAEVERIAAKLREALRSRPVDAVLTGGDFNLVASRQVLDVLRLSFDPAGGDLAEDGAVRLDGWATWTNSPGPGAPFMRSKLDYVLYSPSRLERQRAFVFDSQDLTPQWLAHYKLRADDSAISDHRPVVIDLAWK